MDKYYTPSIEEFHVGFEFEVNYTGEGWLKEIFCNGTGKNIDSIGKLKSFLGKTTFEDAYRVKYLNKEDIESLGWKFEGGRLLKNIQDVFNKGEYTLTYHYPTKTLYIEDMVGDVVKNLTIKNKSELKKILKQLNVKE